MPQCGSTDIRYPTGSSNATTDADREASKNLALAGIRGQAGIARDIKDNLQALPLPPTSGYSLRPPSVHTLPSDSACRVMTVCFNVSAM